MKIRTNISTGAGGSSGIAPKNVQNLSVRQGNTSLKVSWSDPTDTVVEGETLCVWKGTKLVYKTGSYPKSASDGTLVVDNQERDKYATDGVQINGLVNGTTYYFAAFPYSDKKVYNKNEANRITGTPVAYRTMSVIIDQSNSNPSTCVTYADDAEGLQAGSQEIIDFLGYYPCLFKDGEETRLNPNNYAELEGGGTADITSGNAGDVMVTYPIRGLSITTTGNSVKISITDDPNNANFQYYAHQRGTTKKDCFRVGAYLGYNLSSKLRSLSGKTPSASINLTNMITYAQANGKADGKGGSGYDPLGFYQLTYIQAINILLSKSINSETLTGKGYTNSSNSKATNTGGANAYGMNCEIIKASNPSYLTDGKHQTKVAGLEDFYGNLYQWIVGLFCNSSRKILTATDNFNATGSGYTDQGSGGSSNISGYISAVQGTSETGFIPKTCSGSATTYYCDYGSLVAGYFPHFGGHWGSDSGAGAFFLDVYYSASNSYSSLGGRLMYL